MDLLAKQSLAEQPWFIIVALLVLFGTIVLAVILFKKFVLNRNKENTIIDEDKAREEELNRVLQPITDEESIKAMEELDSQEK